MPGGAPHSPSPLPSLPLLDIPARPASPTYPRIHGSGCGSPPSGDWRSAFFVKARAWRASDLPRAMCDSSGADGRMTARGFSPSDSAARLPACAVWRGAGKRQRSIKPFGDRQVVPSHLPAPRPPPLSPPPPRTHALHTLKV